MVRSARASGRGHPATGHGRVPRLSRMLPVRSQAPDTDQERSVKPGGQPNMQQLMKQAQKMQQQMAAAQAELATAEVTGTAGGGLVTVTLNGAGDVLSLKIDPKSVDPDDVESLEDLVLAAIRDGVRQARELAATTMGPVSGAMGGLGLGL